MQTTIRMRVDNSGGREPSALLSDTADRIYTRFIRRYRGKMHPESKMRRIGTMLRHKYPCEQRNPSWPTASITIRH